MIEVEGSHVTIWLKLKITIPDFIDKRQKIHPWGLKSECSMQRGKKEMDLFP